MGKPILMTLEKLAPAVGASLFPASSDKTRGFTSVSIDSRTVSPGSLFVALGGNSQDGHSFVEKAFASGAVMAMVAQSRMDSMGPALRSAAQQYDGVLVIVPHTLRALQDAALAYIRGFPQLLRVGITGSAGKTTTKELAAAMIALEKGVVMNAGNLNSEIGLPLSVFSVRAEHQVGIFEMGMNRFGEIEELARILRPQIALITNIGTAHIGILGSREAIAKEKKAIFSQFSGAEVALIPERDSFAAFLADGVQGRIRSYGTDCMASLGGYKSLGLEGSELVWGDKKVRFSLPGLHNVYNALAAAAIAEEVGVHPDAIRQALGNAKPLFGRGEIFRGPVTVVQDCYNANPEAAASAIEFCDSVDWPGRRVYVIGSMLELGSSSVEEHRKLGRLLASSKVQILVLFGPETEEIKNALDEVYSTVAPEEKIAYPKPLVLRADDMEILKQKIVPLLTEGDLVLLKGSRGTALERLTEVVLPSVDKNLKTQEGA
jgi:UDP-N-acetylmuramoyl-tripeptide--D-alanyl-D-alanine ligase